MHTLVNQKKRRAIFFYKLSITYPVNQPQRIPKQNLIKQDYFKFYATTDTNKHMRQIITLFRSRNDVLSKRS